MKTLFKGIGFIFAILFFVAAALQYNDPDSLIWIVIWVLAGLLSLGFALNKVSYSVLLICGILALAGFFYCFPEKFEGFEIGTGDIKNIEEGREAFGLLIISIVLLVLGLRGRFAKS